MLLCWCKDQSVTGKTEIVEIHYFTVHHNSKTVKKKYTSDFIVFFTLFGEFNHFEECRKREREKRIYCRREEVRHREVTPE